MTAWVWWHQTDSKSSEGWWCRSVTLFATSFTIVFELFCSSPLCLGMVPTLPLCCGSKHFSCQFCCFSSGISCVGSSLTNLRCKDEHVGGWDTKTLHWQVSIVVVEHVTQLEEAQNQLSCMFAKFYLLLKRTNRVIDHSINQTSNWVNKVRSNRETAHKNNKCERYPPVNTPPIIAHTPVKKCMKDLEKKRMKK